LLLYIVKQEETKLGGMVEGGGWQGLRKSSRYLLGVGRGENR